MHKKAHTPSNSAFAPQFLYVAPSQFTHFKQTIAVERPISYQATYQSMNNRF